jgi:hypothetical protein
MISIAISNIGITCPILAAVTDADDVEMIAFVAKDDDVRPAGLNADGRDKLDPLARDGGVLQEALDRDNQAFQILVGL